MSTYIIAEAGVNHNGDLDKAIEMVKVASGFGADAIKFQSFKASRMVTKNVQKAKYQKLNTNKLDNQYTMIKELELTSNMHEKIINECNKQNIEFLSTPFDIESLNMLANDFGIKKIKISSGDITNAPLLVNTGYLADEIILSTGMSDLNDINNGLKAISFGLLNFIYDECNTKMLNKAFTEFKKNKLLRKKIKLLHCTTEYPAPLKEANLKAIETLKKKYNVQIGYSDHTNGINTSLAAVALGAEIIEKHFTLNKSLKGPDHKASLNPKEFRLMVKGIREVEKTIGNGKKMISPSETKNINIARKFLVASSMIKKGEKFSKNNITCKRSGGGISPFDFWKLIKGKSKRNYEYDDVIDQ